MQIVRHIIQLVSFFVLPGLFLTVFLAIKDVYTALIGGTFVFSALALSVLQVIAALAATAIFGRFICGFLCSFGALQDLMWGFLQHTAKIHLTIPKKVDRVLKYLKYVILLFIVIFGWTLGWINFEGSLSPWSVFGFYATSVANWTSTQMLFTVGMIFLILIMLASMFIERFFCRYLCPLGAIFTLVSKARLMKIRKMRTGCGNCRLCTAKCSMGIPLSTLDTVNSGECIDCFRCVEICPRGNAAVNPKPAVATTIALAATCGMVYAGNVLGDVVTASAETSQISASADESTSSLTDSAASGSETDSSISGNQTVSSDSQAETDSSASDSESSSSDGTYQDGTYEGSGTGLRGTTGVSVVVSGGKITSISITSYQDDDQYFNRAKNTIISEVISAQGIDVNTVSGATFSSNGILEAIADALNIDFTNPNSSMTGGGHGGPH